MSFLEDKKELEALLHAHDTGLAPIEPHWVRNTTEEDLLAAGVGWLHHWRTSQGFRYGDWQFLREGLVLADVMFTQLLPALNPEYSAELKQWEFIDRRALKILKQWQDKIPLTAPCCALNQDGSEVQVYVGNHRTNSALRLAVPLIQLLVPKGQLLRLQELIGDFTYCEQPLINFKDSDA